MADKQLWILSGGNGSGKSTFYDLEIKHLGLDFVNADLIAKKLGSEPGEDYSKEAMVLAEQYRERLLSDGLSFCFETVFSHPSKIDFMAKAKAMGYSIILVYIHLIDTQLNVARVDARVNQGGHSVPTDKIINRVPRTMKHIKSALPLADHVMFFDNSDDSDPYVLLAEIENQTLSIQCKLPLDWLTEMTVDYQG